jgi:hypothetical protein
MDSQNTVWARQKWEYLALPASLSTGGLLSSEVGASAIWTVKSKQGKTPLDYVAEYGANGWELVSVTPSRTLSTGVITELLFMFKRPSIE